MDRKSFLKSCGIVCMGSSVLALLESCGTTNYFAQTTTENNKIIIKKTEFTKVEIDKTTERKYVLINNPKFNFPIIVYKINQNEYSAVLAECTHKSCELQPHGEYLMCPCHGSEFNKHGVVQNPPAEINLTSFPITTDLNNIYVQI